jgi:hypothetical protein
MNTQIGEKRCFALANYEGDVNPSSEALRILTVVIRAQSFIQTTQLNHPMDLEEDTYVTTHKLMCLNSQNTKNSRWYGL